MPQTINDGYEEVGLNRLKPHPRNVNQGDHGAILQSVQQNGFFGALVAQRSTGYILAGNHRYYVAKSAGFETLPVIWVDVDDEESLRIMLADNRTARLGTDDTAALAALLAELSQTDNGLTGTGFDGDDLDTLIADLTREPDSQESPEEDNGKNPDGSVWAICPSCGHEFEAKHGKAHEAKR